MTSRSIRQKPAVQRTLPRVSQTRALWRVSNGSTPFEYAISRGLRGRKLADNVDFSQSNTLPLATYAGRLLRLGWERRRLIPSVVVVAFVPSAAEWWAS